MRQLFTARIRIISGVMIVVALVVLGRLYLVQVVRGDVYSERAERQYVRPQEGIFERGDIYFEDKDGSRVWAATLQAGFTLAINPTLIEFPKETYEALGQVMELDEGVFLNAAAKVDDPYEVIARRIRQETAEEIVALNIPGVSVFREQWRHYPGEDLAAQTIGFVAFDGDELVGRYGLERYYDDVLERDADTAYVNFFAEVFSNVGDILAGSERGRGDIVATIEPTVQTHLEEALAETNDTWVSRSSGGIIINPKNGEIYALAVHPSFDLNRFGDVENPLQFGNPIVESVFEMGSIIKALTMAAALDAGAVVPGTTYNDTGTAKYGIATIANYDGKARGVVDMIHVLGESLNVGAAWVEQQMGNSVFAKYMHGYGLGEETGIDLPGEVRGLLDNLKSPRDIEYVTASFGQGIAMTPIATVRALATLGNGGTLITPHVVKEIVYEVGPSTKIFYEPGEQVITPQTSEVITRMLVEVVDEWLVGGTVELPRYSIAAKTGTAQISSPDGGYYDDRFFHSFFGYFPAYNPQFLIFLYTQEPKGVRFASQTLTDPFMELAKFLITYYEIPPDR